MTVPSLDAVPDVQRALFDALARAEADNDDWTMEPVNHDGLRCRVGDGGDWLIARASLHEPKISLQMEADDPGGAAAMCATMLQYVADLETTGVALSDLKAKAAQA